MVKISAIDVGSNAMRMVIGEVDEARQVHTIENIRLPVRLGQDVFSKGYLEEKTIQQTEEVFLRFKQMAEDYDVQELRAVATSAAREAANSDLLIDRVFQTSGIEIEIISGEEEARLIHLGVAHILNLKNKRTLLIDIGGGSVDVTISHGQNIISTDSYSLGTVRLLEKVGASQNTPWGISCANMQKPHATVSNRILAIRKSRSVPGPEEMWKKSGVSGKNYSKPKATALSHWRNSKP